ncbi:MAG: phosphoribosylanthranilate isomerase [Steroidobacteraceae bacterium]
MWIKMCGMTTALAVRTAVATGVDAVGFVFAKSKRQVSANQAVQLAADVPGHVARVAVMLHPTQIEVDEVLSVFQPDILQTDWQDLEELVLPQSLMVLPVMRAGHAVPAGLAKRFLFEGPKSGTGETADWLQAAQLATQGELILAGGLSPENVAEAIAAVRPFGVDVSSGIEAVPGLKSPEKMQAFVKAVRAVSA